MTEEEALIHNEKVRFRLLMQMLEQIEGIRFETEVGIKLHQELTECISGVIRPIIIQRAKELIE